MDRRQWTRDELVQALSLYCQIPFGRMHRTNPLVVRLAERIGRTPSAVALKLVNFASLDPELRDRGVRGMANTSTADRRVWDEFYGQWEVLASESGVGEDDDPAIDTEVELTTKARRGQAFFRSSVLAAYDMKCCITGLETAGLLRASHIVPWAHDASLRLDPRNGLCLNALHDAAFDRGLVTLNEGFELVVSSSVRDDTSDRTYSDFFGRFEGRRISMPERFAPGSEMLEFHRRHVFVA